MKMRAHTSKDLNQGPLKIWTQHLNFLLQGKGDTKTPTFLERKCEYTYFPKHIKSEDMIKFDIFHILAENSVNTAKIWNSSKMPVFEQLKKQVLLNSNFFWLLIRKILMPLFSVLLWSKSMPSTPTQPQGGIGAPLPYLVISNMKF